MEKYFRHELKQNSNGEYEILIFLDDQLTEFATELGEKTNEQTNFLASVKSLLSEKYPKFRVSVVKVVVGGMAITSIPLVSGNISTAEAAVVQTSTETSQENTIYYHVTSGDTLWVLSKRFNTSVDNIKRANTLVSDSLSLNQRIIIPRSFHTVEKGETLYSIAQKFGTSVEIIKNANGLGNNYIGVGQNLVIPTIFDDQGIKDSGTNQVQSTYTVAAGDSLCSIANRFKITVSAIKNENNLSSDVLNIGQKIIIPTGNATNNTIENKVPSTDNIQYKVVAGDSLWVIAQKYQVTVDAIRGTNNLDTDNLRVGQILVIPKQDSGVLAPSLTPAKETIVISYTVVRGDTLYSIAIQHNVTVEQLKLENQLMSNTISIGQVLKIPNGNETVKDNGTNTEVESTAQEIQNNLNKLGYNNTVPTSTGNYDNPTTAIKQFQSDYGLDITGKPDSATTTAIEHALVKQKLVNDTRNYLGVPYLWGGTTPSGFDCSGFVYYMFNKHGVDMPRNTSSSLYTQGQIIPIEALQPGDLVFYSLNATGTITHVGFYLGDNQWVSATSSKGIAIYSLDNSYWSKYYVGAKRIY